MKMPRMTNLEFKQWLETRFSDFAVSVFKLLDAIPRKNSTTIIAYQLGKSASSIGANYCEANRAESRDDFIHKVQIAMKESAESCYWLGILVKLYPTHEILGRLAKEACELRNLLQSISKSAHGRVCVPNNKTP